MELACGRRAGAGGGLRIDVVLIVLILLMTVGLAIVVWKVGV